MLQKISAESASGYNAEFDPTPPATVEEMHRQLDLIIEACKRLEDLKTSGVRLTHREVLKLRKAYWLAVGETQKLRRDNSSRTGSLDGLETSETSIVDRPLSSGSSVQVNCSDDMGLKRQDAKALSCDEELVKLEKCVEERPEAHTFDVVHDLAEAMNTGWRIFGIPLERRLQTLAVSVFNFFAYVSLSLMLIVVMMMNQVTMVFVILYVLYIFTIGRPKHPLKKKDALMSLGIWHHFTNYFPVRLVVPQKVRCQFDSSKNYLFIYHPHGINSFGALSCFMLDTMNLRTILPGIRIHLQTLKLNFYIPFWRELAVAGGCGDASAQCIRDTLRKGPGECVALVVGGAKESLLARPKRNEVALQDRKGFVRIALQEGISLVPVYGFGENDVYRIPRFAESNAWRRVEGLVRKYTRFAIPLVKGRGWFNYGFGLSPHRCPITVVFGEPIEVPRIPEPTAEEVQIWHAKYVEALQRLFSENHTVFAADSKGLVIR